MKKKSLIADLVKMLKEDKGYYLSWQASIAVMFKDAYAFNSKKYKNKKDIHEISNHAAKAFLNMLIKESDEILGSKK